MKPNEPERVQREYESERGLEARTAAHDRGEGADETAMIYDAVAEIAPSDILEVGCGTGALAARMATELSARVVAVDQSPRMVELTCALGVDARVADVQSLPFGDGEFECVVAAWVLYHVEDVGRALDEIVRVLRRGGRLVAATSYPDDLRELFEFLGLERIAAEPFNAANGPELLHSRFARVGARDALGTLTFADRNAVRAYVEPSVGLFDEVGEVPELLEPLVVRRRSVVFVADKA